MSEESRYVSRGTVVVLSVVAVLLAGNGAQAVLRSDPSRIELVTRCLEREKALLVSEPGLDSAAFRAGVDAVRTTIETNGVVIAVAGSLEAALALERVAAAGATRVRVERRGDVVYEWDRAPSPTQRQGAYDCTY